MISKYMSPATRGIIVTCVSRANICVSNARVARTSCEHVSSSLSGQITSNYSRIRTITWRMVVSPPSLNDVCCMEPNDNHTRSRFNCWLPYKPKCICALWCLRQLYDVMCVMLEHKHTRKFLGFRNVCCSAHNFIYSHATSELGYPPSYTSSSCD